MRWLFLIMISGPLFAQVKTDTFIIQIKDRSMNILAPEKKREFYPVTVENLSLSDQLGKFTVQGRLLKYIKVKPGKSETVEIENKSAAPVVFVPVSPAFQEVELTFGKKAYEIPSKE